MTDVIASTIDWLVLAIIILAIINGVSNYWLLKMVLSRKDLIEPD